MPWTADAADVLPLVHSLILLLGLQDNHNISPIIYCMRNIYFIYLFSRHHFFSHSVHCGQPLFDIRIATNKICIILKIDVDASVKCASAALAACACVNEKQ